jgi:hypothetical protein
MFRRIPKYPVLLFLAVAFIPPWLIGACCPGPLCPLQNQPPVANAGANQTVDYSVPVTLSGTGSTDPDGDTLTYAWTQTGGTPNVTLTGANTATATFTSPAAEATLAFQLTVNDGNGGTDSATVIVTVHHEAPASRTLFVANMANSVIGYTFTAITDLDGNIGPGMELSGTTVTTQLSLPRDVWVNSANQLLVANSASSSVTTYDNASTIIGTVAPSGTLTTPLVLPAILSTPVSLASNASGNLLFVSSNLNNQILVFNTFSGNVSPIRRASAGMASPQGIHLTAGDELYVANGGPNDVVVFANASTMNLPLAPDRTITGPTTFFNVRDVFVDATNHMYVVNGSGGSPNANRILIFNDASTLAGLSTPVGALSVLTGAPGAMNLAEIVVDSSGNGYISDTGKNAIYVFANIATLNAPAGRAPDATLTGSNTHLFGPTGLFLR